MQKCPACEFSLPDEFRFCTNCGMVFGILQKNQSLPEKVTYRQCLFCNKLVPKENHFCVNCGHVFTTFPIKQAVSNSPVIVHWNSEEERIQVATEIVNVPSGVVITIKRSRTVEHTIDVTWSIAGNLELDIGLKNMIQTSIRGEVEHIQGKTLH